jgi:hypothetical protein
MSPVLSNRPRLDDILKMPIGQVAALPAEELALLQEEASARVDAAKRLADWLNGAIVLKYDERAIAALFESGKSTGTVRFDDGDVTVIADLPKKVEWDQKRLTALVAMIRAEGDDPGQYITTEFKVSERSYNSWPSRIREVFAPARTTRMGRMTVKLALEPPELQRGRPSP